ncbi:MAG TPA: hypothetical protein DCM32_08485 [Xanthomonadaceae bacterium]|jgi:hypothetical protein|nr:hypothetical protein [Xanthomonadaceae bacterium]
MTPPIATALAAGIAPEFDERVGWLNTAPTPLAALRGHPLLLLFWNAGSAHCHNALVAAQALAHRFRGDARVLAVHVPKYEFERDGMVAWAALQSEGATLPLVNDADWSAWQHYGLSAWPAAVLVDADGRLAGRFVGDRAFDSAQAALEALVDANYGCAPGVADMPRLDANAPRGPLATPGGLVVTASRLYVADSGHHRILECTHDGRVVRRIGNGNRDSVDGLADVAGFNGPRGMVVLQDRLYVADTGNHAIRRINTRTGEVDTLVGSGRPGDPTAGALRLPADSALDRPWGLAAVNSTLLVTQASGHQVWALELGTRVLRRVSGSGAFGDSDGDADSATFAQPTGIVASGDQAFVLDAAASSLRQVRLADGSVRTLFGRGIHEFGLKDGGLRHALMQYPTALAPMVGTPGLWIADTGNGALRKWVTRNQALSTVELPNALQRPAALASFQNWLWIADAGSHMIWRLDVDSGEMQRLPVGE